MNPVQVRKFRFGGHFGTLLQESLQQFRHQTNLRSESMWKPRVASIKDAPAIASVHIRAWQTTYRGIVADEVLDGLKSENRTQQWTEILGHLGHHTFVVEDADKGIIGFADGGPERRGNLGFEGELYAIYLLQEYRGQGIGKTLFRQVVYALRKSGMVNMMLWVLEENPYRYFYEGMGAATSTLIP